MNKYTLLYGFLLSICFSCSAQQNDTNLSTETEISISLEKEILTSLEASLGTMSMSKVGDYLILHDSHVSDLKLICINYISGEEIWSIETGVDRYFIYNNLIIIDFDDYTSAHQVENGEEIWRVEGVCVSYKVPNGDEVDGDLPVHYNGKIALLDLSTHAILTSEYGFIEAYYFHHDGDIVKRNIIGIENKYDYNGEILSIVVVENSTGQRKEYIWMLDKEKREFYLFSTNPRNLNTQIHTWKMDEGERLPEDYFNGNPEPHKLSSSVEFVDDKLFFFENYVNYRWSWNRGCNRITCVEYESGDINYQKWGQAPGQIEFNSFLFFDNAILYADNIMHFQDVEGKFSKFDYKNGQISDSLPQRATVMKDYDKEHLLGFIYESENIKESEYNYAIQMKLWNIKENTFSDTYRFDYKDKYPNSPFVFGDDGLIIIYFYLDDIDKSMLHCYKITE